MRFLVVAKELSSHWLFRNLSKLLLTRHDFVNFHFNTNNHKTLESSTLFQDSMARNDCSRYWHAD